jgi:hypothetical protein
MIEYDSKLIYNFAENLYKQAAQVIFSSTLFGVVLGLVAGGVGDYFRFGRAEIKLGVFAVAGALVGGLLGFMAGQQKAFELRLRAQTALCQVNIEQNTRPKAAA